MSISNTAISRHLSGLSARLRSARLRADLTQSALAERTGVSLKTVANAEDGGKISVETLVRLLDGLGLIAEFDALLSSVEVSPVQIAARKGRARQRASRGDSGDAPADEWQW